MDRAAFIFTDWERNKIVLQPFCTRQFPGLLWGWKESYRGCGRLSRSLESSTLAQSSVGNFQAQSVAGSLMTQRWYYLCEYGYSIICHTGGLNEYEKWGARGWQSACSWPCSTQLDQGCCCAVVQKGNAWRIRYVEQLLLAWSWRMLGDMVAL